jgi:hypothetical protein
VRSLHNTLIVEAVKTRETDPEAIRLAWNLPPGLELSQPELFLRFDLPWQRQKAFELNSQQWSAVQKARRLDNYGQVRQHLLRELGESCGERVIAYLVANRCFSLDFEL